MQVLLAPKGVNQFQGGQAQGHRVDGEVAAEEVFLQVCTEGHDRLTGIGVVLFSTVGGDFNHLIALADADGAVLLADFPGSVGPAVHHSQGFIGSGIGSEVQIYRGFPQKQVTDGTTHQGQLEASAGK